MYDIIVIGAGVTGSAVARELSRYKYNVLVLEKCSDVGEGTSRQTVESFMQVLIMNLVLLWLR